MNLLSLVIIFPSRSRAVYRGPEEQATVCVWVLPTFNFGAPAPVARFSIIPK